MIRPFNGNCSRVLRALGALGFASGSVLFAQTAEACPQTPLPVMDCATNPTSTSPCCTGGSIFDDVANPPPWAGSNNFCTEALVSQIFASSCTEDALDKHDILFHINLEAGATGAGSCDGSMDYGKHWNAAQLIPTLIQYKPGITWHHPIADYYRAALAESNGFHAELEHFFGDPDPEGKANASYNLDFVGKNNLRFFCPLFSNGTAGSPLYRASDFIHEAWHDTYGSHDFEDPDADSYAVHDHTLGPGEMNQEADVEDGLPAESSVYQVQYEFLCDVNTTPHDWVPRALAWEAGLLADDLLVRKYKKQGVGAFLLPPPMTCNNAPPMRRNPDVPAITNGRLVNIRIDADLHETDEPIGGPTDEHHGADLSFMLTPENPTANTSWISPRLDDQVWIKYVVFAQLRADGQTVDLTYDMAFYETNSDLEEDCEETLSNGPDCKEELPWPTMVLDNNNYSPAPIVFNLDNSHSWDDPDRASGTITVTMDW
jgi:hypothetical protein